MATLYDTYLKKQAESEKQLNSMYNSQYNAQAQALKTEYDQNMAKAQGELQKVAPAYQSQANQMAANYERQRRNANMSSLNNGMNSGTVLQQQNAMNNVYLQNYGMLRGQEADAINKANQGMADLTTAYNNALVKAKSDVNAKRDQALLTSRNQNRDKYEEQAINLANNYGITSEVANIYGAANARNMQNTWIAKNPDVAYRAGMISKADYKKLTGKDPNKK